MASLKKPKNCSCGSTNMTRKKKPEKWICADCKSVIVERPMRNPTGVCRECGDKREDKHANLCKKCKSKLHKTWREDNTDKLVEYRKKYYQSLDKGVRNARVRKAVQRSPQAFITSLMAHIRKRSMKSRSTAMGGTHTNAPIHVCDIDYDYLWGLYETQEGRCALTGVPLSHTYGSMLAVSVDRIDSNQGYVRGNVQLVCSSANLAKKNYTQDEMLEWLSDITESFRSKHKTDTTRSL